MIKNQEDVHSEYNRLDDKLPDAVLKTVQMVNRKNPMPLYQQLHQCLLLVLEEGELEPGSFFATENLLQQATNMSRATIRKTLEELVRQNYLMRITGKGTFVSLKVPEDHIVLPQLKSLTQDLIDKGMRPGTILVDSNITQANEQVAKELKLKRSDTVLFTKRVRTGNGIPLLYLESYIPTHIGITSEKDLPNSLYKLIGKCGKIPYEATHIIKATIVPNIIAKHLGLKANSAGLAMQRTTYDTMGLPVLYEEGIYRGDLYSYNIKMQNGV